MGGLGWTQLCRHACTQSKVEFLSSSLSGSLQRNSNTTVLPQTVYHVNLLLSMHHEHRQSYDIVNCVQKLNELRAAQSQSFLFLAIMMNTRKIVAASYVQQYISYSSASFKVQQVLLPMSQSIVFSALSYFPLKEKNCQNYIMQC